MGKKIVIIGGGVIGMSTAFHLANNGIKDITIIEKDSIGSGSSSQAAGIVTCLQWNATSVVARMKTLDLFENFRSVTNCNSKILKFVNEKNIEVVDR